MTITFSKFQQSLNNYFLYENKPHIVVGTSGGPDSIALTFILNKWIIFIAAINAASTCVY